MVKLPVSPIWLIQKILDALVHLSSDHPLNVKLLSPTTNLQPTPSWVQQIPYTDDMATLYRWTNLAICGGGSTQWEMSFFGIPRLAIILADNQLSTTEFLHQNQCCINAGRYETLTKSSLIENLKLLFSNHAMRVAMREKNQSLIDGQGVKRVCEFIQARIPCPK